MLVPLYFPGTMGALDEAHAAFCETAREQALPAKVVRLIAVEPVELFRRVGLAVNLQRFRGYGLHSKGQLKSLDTALQLGVVIARQRMPAVHFLKHVQLETLELRSYVAYQVLDRLGKIAGPKAGISERRSLVGRRQERGTPIFSAAVRQRRLDGDVTWQVLVFASEAVQSPRAHGRTRKSVRSSVQLKGCAAVGHAVPHDGAEHANIIDARTNRRKKIAHFDPALTVRPELPGRLHQSPDLALGERERPLKWQRLAMVFREFRFVIEGIDAGGPAMHEQKDDALGARREMGWTRLQWIGRLGPTQLRKQSCEPEATEAATGLA